MSLQCLRKSIFTSLILGVGLWLGLPTARAQIFGSGPIVPELAPLEAAMTNYLVSHQFNAGTLALMHGSKLVFRQGYGCKRRLKSAAGSCV